MIGMAAEALNADPRTKPVIFLQLTWSAGDHLVARRGIKTIKDLRNKTIVLQQGGRMSACSTTCCAPPA
jgi:hypothetical protein